MSLIHLLAASVGGRLQPQLENRSVDAFVVSGSVTAEYRVTPAGVAQSVIGAAVSDLGDDYSNIKYATVGERYEVRFERGLGMSAAGTFDTWLTIDQNRSVTLSQIGFGVSQETITVRVRVANSSIEDSATVTLTAEVAT